MENVEKGPNNIMSGKLERKRTVFNGNLTFAFGRHVGCLGFIIQHGDKKKRQHTFQNSN